MNDENPLPPAHRRGDKKTVLAQLAAAPLLLAALVLLNGCAALHPVLGTYLDMPPDMNNFDAARHYWGLSGLIYLLLLAMSAAAYPLSFLLRLLTTLHQKLGVATLRTKILTAALGGTVVMGYAAFQSPWLKPPPAPMTGVHSDMIFEDGPYFDDGGVSNQPPADNPAPSPAADASKVGV